MNSENGYAKPMTEALARIAALTELLRECKDFIALQADAEVEHRALNDLSDGEEQYNVKRARTLAAKITTTLAAVPMTGETK